MSHAHRRPHHVTHAEHHDGSVDNKAVAAEMRHAADLIENGQIKLRNASESKLADGWDRITFERKLDPSLTTEGAQTTNKHNAPAPGHA
jgi:hypothetical protein